MKIISVIVFMLIITAYCITRNSGGPVILCGGGKIPDTAVQIFKQKQKTGKFVVVSCHDTCYNRWREPLNEPIFVLPENISSISIDSIAGVLIEGGDQWQYLTRLDNNYLQQIHDCGIPIMGTSAGAMILSEYYFSAEKDTITSEQARRGENVCLGRGFLDIKYLKGIIVDTHFLARDRLGRLEVFVKTIGNCTGIGIDEQTALYIDDSHFMKLGEGNITILRK